MGRGGDNLWVDWEKVRPCWRDCRGYDTEASGTVLPISTAGTVDKNEIDSGSLILTLNSKLDAEGEMICTSCAVAALCIAFGPGWANETLPTVTVWTIVRD